MNVSGWIQASKKTGDKFMSLRFEAKGEQPKPKVAPAMSEDNWSDLDTPF
jgi:hypothetical protein